ncbi:MAG: peptidylprolyl isomerase, partial [Pirellulaceae bacterium]
MAPSNRMIAILITALLCIPCFAQSPDEDTKKPDKPKTEAEKAFQEKVVLWRQATQDFWEVINRFHTARGDIKFSEQENWAEHESAVRHAMSDALQAAVPVLNEQPEHAEVRPFVARSVLTRAEFDWFEVTTEAAIALLNAGVEDPELNAIAAVAAVATGQFEIAEEQLTKISPTSEEGLSKVARQMAMSFDKLRAAWEAELEKRKQEAEKNDLPRVVLSTTRGDVVVELFEDDAPNTVASFISLVEKGFYDYVPFYQVVKHEFAQTGDREGDGSGKADYRIRDENSSGRGIFRGSLVMAKIPNPAAAQSLDAPSTIPDTASSQFIIALLPFSPDYKELTTFGRVIEGIDVISTLNRVTVEKDENAMPMLPDTIIKAEVIRKRD